METGAALLLVSSKYLGVALHDNPLHIYKYAYLTFSICTELVKSICWDPRKTVFYKTGKELQFFLVKVSTKNMFLRTFSADVRHDAGHKKAGERWRQKGDT